MAKLTLSQWLQIATQFAPQILLFTPLAPIAGNVAAAIVQAEQIKGATGPQKLAKVTAVAVEAAKATNAQAGRVVVDPEMVSSASAQAVSLVVTVVNGIHKSTDIPTEVK